MKKEVIEQDNENTSNVVSEVSEKKEPRKNVGIILFIGLLAITALSLSGMTYYLIGNLNSRINIYEAMPDQVQAVESLIINLKNTNKRIEESLENLSERQDDLVTGLNSLYLDQRHDNLDWVLAEVEYLLIIASHRLSLADDVATALAAMQAADNRLKNITDPRILAVRSQLTADMNSLKSINTVDISGLALYLADIVNRVQDLPLNQRQNSDSKPAVPKTEEQGDKKSPLWRRLVNSIWHELKELVIISKAGEAASISLLPEQRYFLYQNLRLKLDIARLAVLNRDTENLRVSVISIKSWLVKYFSTADAGVSNILESLTQMTEIQLDPVLPDINSSLESLRALIQEISRPDPAASGSLESPAS